jgi:putative SOS response-associated peptidase YedK
MCGRFTATFELSDIRVRWNLHRDLSNYTPRFNVAPETSPNIPVIFCHKGVNECRLIRWGLILPWAADPTIGNRMINARTETLTDLPSFKHIVDQRRCIIPADGFSMIRPVPDNSLLVPLYCEYPITGVHRLVPRSSPERLINLTGVRP